MLKDDPPRRLVQALKGVHTKRAASCAMCWASIAFAELFFIRRPFLGQDAVSLRPCALAWGRFCGVQHGGSSRLSPLTRLRVRLPLSNAGDGSVLVDVPRVGRHPGRGLPAVQLLEGQPEGRRHRFRHGGEREWSPRLLFMTRPRVREAPEKL